VRSRGSRHTVLAEFGPRRQVVCECAADTAGVKVTSVHVIQR
jgi:hypothetical protein